MSETPEQRIEIHLVYLGLRLSILKGGKPGHVYYRIGPDWADFPRIDENHLDGNEMIFPKPLGRWHRPGQIFKGEGTESSVFSGTFKTIGSYPNEACNEWEGLSTASEDSLRVEKQIEKDGSREISLEVLAPLQKAYRGLRTRQERAILLGRVIDSITRGYGL